MIFSDLVKTERAKRFATSKEFHGKAALSCSYYYYSKIESGTVPDLKIATEIIRSLRIPIKQGIYAYLRSAMPDDETRALFDVVELPAIPESLNGEVTVKKTLVLNHAQNELLKQDPVYLELTLYLACYSRFHPIAPCELAAAFRMDERIVTRMLVELETQGIIRKADGNGCYITKAWIYTPEEEIFTPLRDQTISRALSKHIAKPANMKWQKTITRVVTAEQKAEIEALLDAVTANIAAMTDPKADAARPVSIGLFSSWRDFGDA